MLIVAQSWLGVSASLPSHGRFPARCLWASRTPHRERFGGENQLPFKALSFSARFKHRLRESEIAAGNFGGRSWCWGISDRHPVASVPLVSLNVVKGPEGDGECLPVIDHSPPASFSATHVPDPEAEDHRYLLSWRKTGEIIARGLPDGAVIVS